MAKMKTYTHNGIKMKSKDSAGYGNCTVCKAPLFSMEYVYNGNICNPCLGKKGNKKDE